MVYVQKLQAASEVVGVYKLRIGGRVTMMADDGEIEEESYGSGDFDGSSVASGSIGSVPEVPAPPFRRPVPTSIAQLVPLPQLPRSDPPLAPPGTDRVYNIEITLATVSQQVDMLRNEMQAEFRSLRLKMFGEGKDAEDSSDGDAAEGDTLDEEGGDGITPSPRVRATRQHSAAPPVSVVPPPVSRRSQARGRFSNRR